MGDFMKTQRIRTFRKNLRRIEREIVSQLKDETTCCGVSLAQCHALLEIGQQKETTISDLAYTLKLDKSTLSRTIDGLVRIGHVDRVINPNDRRFMRIALSDQGISVYDSINQTCDTFYTNVFQHIPDEKHDQVIEGLGLLVDAFISAKNETSETCSPAECSLSK